MDVIFNIKDFDFGIELYGIYCLGLLTALNSYTGRILYIAQEGKNKIISERILIMECLHNAEKLL